MKSIHVAAGVVVNDAGDILLARRPEHAHQGGLWEFPGGKVEPDETPQAALRRELHEEVGLDIAQSRPFIQIEHSYPDKRVLLDVYRVLAYQGKAHGREGQPVRWVSTSEMRRYAMPAANLPIVTAVRLPDRYLITGAFEDADDFLFRLERALRQGVRLVQLRAKWLELEELKSMTRRSLALCRAHGASLLVNAAPDLIADTDADGVHLSSARLMQCQQRPLGADAWVGASVHNEAELEHAHAIGVDFVVVAPVLATTSHLGAATIGWDGFRRLARRARVPAYALGGVGPAALDTAFAHGGQGIAAIGALWGDTKRVGGSDE
jgi:8-oxo-dGTP diphosphatase